MAFPSYLGDSGARGRPLLRRQLDPTRRDAQETQIGTLETILDLVKRDANNIAPFIRDSIAFSGLPNAECMDVVRPREHQHLDVVHDLPLQRLGLHGEDGLLLRVLRGHVLTPGILYSPVW